MKKTLPLLALLLSTAVFAQNNSSTSTAFIYNSVRPLTEINNPVDADAFPWISPDGLRLYYTAGPNDVLMFTERPDTGSLFTPPVTIPISIPGTSSFWFSDDELDVYIIAQDSLYFAQRATTTSAFNTPVLITLIQPFSNTSYREASLNAAQDQLFVTAHSGVSLGIFQFARTSATSFNYVRTLPFPSGYTIHQGQLSKDGLSIFFGASLGTSNPLLHQLTRATLTDTFKMETFEEIQGINDTNFLNDQPSMSDDLNWVVFVRASASTWELNELYIASKSPTITSVINSDQQKSITVFPNPSTGFFTISSSKNGIIEVYNVFGEKIYQNSQWKLNKTLQIDLSSNAKGIYFLIITGETNNIEVRKIIIE